MKIYTGRGDRGNSCLGDGQYLGKNNLRFQVIGAIDELNSWLGLVGAFARENPQIGKILKARQEELFLIGTELVDAKGHRRNAKGAKTLNAKRRDRFAIKKVRKLEKEIDFWQKELPRLKKFIFPGGDQLSALLHCARTICRRAEGELVGLSQDEEVNKNILAYLNRLSDWLFVLARKVNQEAGVKEETWKTSR